MRILWRHSTISRYSFLLANQKERILLSDCEWYHIVICYCHYGWVANWKKKRCARPEDDIQLLGLPAGMPFISGVCVCVYSSHSVWLCHCVPLCARSLCAILISLNHIQCGVPANYFINATTITTANELQFFKSFSSEVLTFNSISSTVTRGIRCAEPL